jgi:hypothetical protein
VKPFLDAEYNKGEDCSVTRNRHEGTAIWSTISRRTQFSRIWSSALKQDVCSSNSRSPVVAMMQAAEPIQFRVANEGLAGNILAPGQLVELNAALAVQHVNVYSGKHLVGTWNPASGKVYYAYAEVHPSGTATGSLLEEVRKVLKSSSSADHIFQ